MQNSDYCLYLDDFREINDTCRLIGSTETRTKELLEYQNQKQWIIVRNYDEFVRVIQTLGLPKIVSFDHDLSDEHYVPAEYHLDYKKSKEFQEQLEKTYKEKTGLDCAKFLVKTTLENLDKKQTFPICYIHSQNEVGADNIERYLLNFMKTYRQFQSTVTNVIEHTYHSR